MFGGSFFPGMMQDPFFGDVGSQMRQMQSMHEQMMHGLMGYRTARPAPALEYGNPGARRAQQQQQVVQRAQPGNPFGFPMMGGGIFGHVNSMFRDMEDMMANPRMVGAALPAAGAALPAPGQQLMHQSDPNTQFYSSSTVMSFSNNGSGAPKVYQASSSTRQGPGGVRETRKMMRDSSTGVEKLHHGRHIGERGHVVQRERNVQTGDREENVEYVNLEEEEAPEFDAEWHSKAGRSNQRAVAEARSRHADTTHYVPTALDKASRHRELNQTTTGGNSKPRRKVRINSKAEIH